MRFTGKCKPFDRIVVSDPFYGEDVWCRYERTGINGKGWDASGFVNVVSEEDEGFPINGKEFVVALCAPDSSGHITLKDDGSFAYFARCKLNNFTIGMDTACVGLGVNEQADDIKACKDEWQPDNCFRTLMDGEFGSVVEGSYNDEVKFIVISGYLDDDTGYSVEDIMNYLGSALNIEFEKEFGIDSVLEDAKEKSNPGFDINKDEGLSLE